MINVKLTPSPAMEDQIPLPGPMEDWTISKLLQVLFPDVRLRQRFTTMPYLEQVTLRQVLDGPNSLERFLAECGRYPQCGELSVKRLREVIERTALAMSWRGRAEQTPQHAMYSHVAATPPQMPQREHQHHGERANAL